MTWPKAALCALAAGTLLASAAPAPAHAALCPDAELMEVAVLTPYDTAAVTLGLGTIGHRGWGVGLRSGRPLTQQVLRGQLGVCQLSLVAEATNDLAGPSSAMGGVNHFLYGGWVAAVAVEALAGSWQGDPAASLRLRYALVDTRYIAWIGVRSRHVWDGSHRWQPGVTLGGGWSVRDRLGLEARASYGAAEGFGATLGITARSR